MRVGPLEPVKHEEALILFQDLWASKDQIKVHAPGDEIPQLAQASSTQEWAKTALEMFERGNYRQAIFCYTRAHLPHERDVSEAYYLREEAQTLLDYEKAGQAFERVALYTPHPEEQTKYYRLGADCLARAKAFSSAAKLYYVAQEFELSLQYYRQARSYKDVIRLLREHLASIKGETANSARDEAACHYLRDLNLRYVIIPFGVDG